MSEVLERGGFRSSKCIFISTDIFCPSSISGGRMVFHRWTDSIFPAAAFAILCMGIVLEVGKLVTVLGCIETGKPLDCY